jgi:hypothetical protein
MPILCSQPALRGCSTSLRPIASADQFADDEADRDAERQRFDKAGEARPASDTPALAKPDDRNDEERHHLMQRGSAGRFGEKGRPFPVTGNF